MKHYNGQPTKKYVIMSDEYSVVMDIHGDEAIELDAKCNRPTIEYDTREEAQGQLDKMREYMEREYPFQSFKVIELA